MISTMVKIQRKYKVHDLGAEDFPAHSMKTQGRGHCPDRLLKARTDHADCLPWAN